MTTRTFFVLSFAAMLLAPLHGWADKYQKDISDTLERDLDSARYLRRLNQLDKAIPALEAILKQKPDYYLAAYNLALAYTDARNFSSAEVWFRRTEELQGTLKIVDYSLYNSYGWMYLVAGRFSEAARQFDVGLNNFEKMPTTESKRKILNNAGLNAYYLGDYKTAEQLLMRAKTDFRSESAESHLKLVQRAKQQEKQQPQEQPQPQPQGQPQPQPQVQPKPAPEPQPQPQPKAQAQPKSQAQPQPQPQPAPTR